MDATETAVAELQLYYIQEDCTTRDWWVNAYSVEDAIRVLNEARWGITYERIIVAVDDPDFQSGIWTWQIEGVRFYNSYIVSSFRVYVTPVSRGVVCSYGS